MELINMSGFSLSGFPMTWINYLGGRDVNDDWVITLLHAAGRKSRIGFWYDCRWTTAWSEVAACVEPWWESTAHRWWLAGSDRPTGARSQGLGQKWLSDPFLVVSPFFLFFLVCCTNCAELACDTLILAEVKRTPKHRYKGSCGVS